MANPPIPQRPERSWSSAKDAPARAATAVNARIVGASTAPSRFEADFVIGSGLNADLRVVARGVAEQHLQVFFDGRGWWVRDLGGGTWFNGQAIQVQPLGDQLELELGQGGPRLELRETRDEAPAAAAPQNLKEPVALSDTKLIENYFKTQGQADGALGEDALRALNRVRRRSRHYRRGIACALVTVCLGVGFIVHQKRKLAEQERRLALLQSRAEDLFYSAQSLEVQIAGLEEVARRTSDPKLLAKLDESRAQLKSMDARYDAFVRELGIYNRLPRDEQVMLRVARRFGECDVKVPREFVAEVHRYVELLRTRAFFPAALVKAKKTYAPVAAREFTRNHLPPDFLFLALQESGFDERAIGPETRYGYAKGMWQFIALTAHDYGLRVGPLSEQNAYDPRDERFDWEKETTAAARYLRDLNTNVTQDSGLLAMACYNWGENKVRAKVDAMPATASERNFWRFLNAKGVPAETYDYVLSIFTMAVICEDPGLFGFNVDCPFPPGVGATGEQLPVGVLTRP